VGAGLVGKGKGWEGRSALGEGDCAEKEAVLAGIRGQVRWAQ